MECSHEHGLPMTRLAVLTRGKEMSLSRHFGAYCKQAKSVANAVYCHFLGLNTIMKIYKPRARI